MFALLGACNGESKVQNIMESHSCRKALVVYKEKRIAFKTIVLSFHINTNALSYGKPKWTKRAFLNIRKSFLNIKKSFINIKK